MLELFVSNINDFKLYFFMLLLIPLILFYLQKRTMRINKYVVLLILIFVFILIHSFLFSFHMEESLRDSLYALLVITDLYLLASIIKSARIYKYYSYLLIILAIIFIGSSDFILLLFNSHIYYHDGNFHGILQNSNTLALYLGVFISPYFFFLLFNKETRKTFFWSKVFLLLNMFYILLLTRSRTGLVIFLVVGIFFYLSEQKNKVKKLKSFSIIVIMMLLTFLVLEDNVSAYIHKNKNSESIVSTRTILWNARIDAIKEKPYIGWGYNVNEYTYIDQFHKFNKLEKGNTFLALLEEFGLIFGSILIVLFTLIFYKSYKVLKAKTSTPYLAVTIIAVLLHSLLETWMFNFYGLFAMIFWLLILASFQNNKGNI